MNCGTATCFLSTPLAVLEIYTVTYLVNAITLRAPKHNLQINTTTPILLFLMCREYSDLKQVT